MARKVFFSFHYERDIWRTNVVRNSGVVEGSAAAGFHDASLWEEAKRKGDVEVKKLIDKGLIGTSVTVVLVGAETSTRKFVDYEIEQSIARGNGLLGIKISGIKDRDGKTDVQEFDHKPMGVFGIGLSLKVTQGARHPIQYYREKELETHVVCDDCTLRYAIYGVFGWCPDCGTHNSVQILGKNLELAQKELALAEAAEKELADHLIGDALENAVSAFDGFGREICLRKNVEIRFQSLPGARRKVQDQFGFDFAEVLSAEQWEVVCRVFQKRHLLAHRMGVIDDDYVQKANDSGAVAGRKVRVTHEEVTSAIALVDALGRRLFRGILPGTI